MPSKTAFFACAVFSRFAGPRCGKGFLTDGGDTEPIGCRVPAVDKHCDLLMDDAEDCGRQPVYVVWASPGDADLKPFYACTEHPYELYEDLVRMGWRVQEPTPL
jgi:hypothetical protein